MSLEAGLERSPGRHDLRRRLVTALILGPVFLLAVAIGRLVFLAAIMLLAGIAAWEFFRLASRKPARPRVADWLAAHTRWRSTMSSRAASSWPMPRSASRMLLRCTSVGWAVSTGDR